MQTFAYDIKRIPYSVDPPAGWKYREGPGLFVFAAVSPESLFINHPTTRFVIEKLVLSEEPMDSVSRPAFRKNGVSFLQGNQMKYYNAAQPIGGAMRFFNGIEGAYVRLAFENEAGVKLCLTQFSFLADTLLYTLVLTSRAQDSARNEKVAEAILGTFRRRNSRPKPNGAPIIP